MRPIFKESWGGTRFMPGGGSAGIHDGGSQVMKPQTISSGSWLEPYTDDIGVAVA